MKEGKDDMDEDVGEKWTWVSEEFTEMAVVVRETARTEKQEKGGGC